MRQTQQLQQRESVADDGCRQIEVAEKPVHGAFAALRLHSPEYLMEAGLLGSFMVSACFFTALFFFPGSPVSGMIAEGFFKRLLIGTAMALTAEIVVVSAGAINSAALLLRSANDKHPRGLANRSDVVGRHSMGHISFAGKLDAITLKAGAPDLAPNFTLELMARHSLDFWLTSEDLPDAENRVTIGRGGKIALAYAPNNLKAHEMLQHELKQAMKHTHCEMHGRDCHQGLFGRDLFVGGEDSIGGCRASERHDPLRARSQGISP